MILYSYWRSTTSYRVRAALNLKGVAYKTVPVNLLTGEQHLEQFRAVNPGYGVPVLELDDGNVLTQSLAIIDFLDATYPDPPMLSGDPALRSKQLAVALTVATDIHPVNNLRVLSQLEKRFGATSEAKRDWMVHWMTEGFLAVEAMLPDRDSFAFDEAPGLADLCIVAQCVNARRWGLPLDRYPKIARVESACLTVPAIVSATPERQPDATF